MIFIATIKEIAKACNVSISTVSNILNGKNKASDEVKKLVLETAKEMNYVPNYMAKNLKQKNTKTIGIIAEDLTIFHTPSIIDGISEFMEEKGYTLLMGNMRLYQKYGNFFYKEENYDSLVEDEVQQMLAKRVEGIIYIEGHYHVMDNISELFSVPLVAVYGRVKNPEITSIIYDDEHGGYEATRELIANGHRKLGLIKGTEASYHTLERRKGFLRALYEYQIPFNPSWEISGDWNRIDGYEGAKRLVKEGVTGIFAMNDLMAAGVYDYAAKHNLTIGKDLSVIGFDNREICAAFTPALSTMALPLRKMGTIAADYLIQKIEHPEPSHQDEYKIPCEILKRKSVCRL